MQDRVTVVIDGRRYVLVTEESEDYMHDIAAYVSEKIDEQKQTFRVSEVEAAVMSALIICDELFKTKQAGENAYNQIQTCVEDTAKAKAEVIELKREISKLRQMLRR
jgi:cell division protein ZapA (FtsZ GTPase activity inhibitor)